MPDERDDGHPALRALLTIGRTARHASVDAVIDLYLEQAVSLTGSRIGFFHFVDEGEQTVRLHTWSRATREVCQVAERGTVYPVSQAGVWLDALRWHRPVIHNDYAGLTERHGLPEGHVPLVREMVVPVLEETGAVAVMGVGNRPTPYTEQDATQLALLAENAWLIIRRRQVEEQREELIRQLEEALASVKRLSGLVPICASCKRVRDDQGFWQQVEAYVTERTEAQFSHGLCPACSASFYEELRAVAEARDAPPPGA